VAPYLIGTPALSEATGYTQLDPMAPKRAHAAILNTTPDFIKHDTEMMVKKQNKSPHDRILLQSNSARVAGTIDGRCGQYGS